MSVSPDMRRTGGMPVGTAWQGNMRSIPFVASIRITPQGKNLWLVAGDGDFNSCASRWTPRQKWGPNKRSKLPSDISIPGAREKPPRRPAWRFGLPGSGRCARSRSMTLTSCAAAKRWTWTAASCSICRRTSRSGPDREYLQWLKERSADLLLDRVGGRWGLMTTTDNELKACSVGERKLGCHRRTITVQSAGRRGRRASKSSSAASGGCTRWRRICSRR